MQHIRYVLLEDSTVSSSLQRSLGPSSYQRGSTLRHMWRHRRLDELDPHRQVQHLSIHCHERLLDL